MNVLGGAQPAPWRCAAAIAATIVVALSACAPALAATSGGTGGASAAARAGDVRSARSGPRVPAPRHVAGVVLVGFRPGVSPARRRLLERAVSASRVRPLIDFGSAPAAQALQRRLGSSFTLGVPRGSVARAVRRLRAAHRWVRYAEPDYLIGGAPRGAQATRVRRARPEANTATIEPSLSGSAGVVPNDPDFGSQWGMLNTGQTITGSSGTVTGTPGEDTHVTQAWRLTTGSASIVIGEPDVGVDYNHPDLASNIWTNPGGVFGCPAGTHGYDLVASTCDPMDQDNDYGGHGTHVAGIMGAVGNNGIGVAGMNWTTSILPIRWNSQENTTGATSTLIAALNMFVKARQAGVNVRVVNDSSVYGASENDPALSSAIQALGANGMLFVTAAGGAYGDGGGYDVDAGTEYPCDFNLSNEICVTGSDQNGNIASWANWGPVNVNLAAPGDNILSTLRNDKYGYISGGSMAAAEVSGAAALILSAYDFSTTPISQQAAALKADIIDHVAPLPSPLDQAKVSSHGGLDVCAAMPGCASKLATQAAVSCAPASVTVGQAATCTAVVADADANSLVAPTGAVTFASNAGGTFASGGSCTLAPGSSPGEASCSIAYTPTAVGSGKHGLTAAYGGDFAHGPSSATSTLTVSAGGGTGGGTGGSGGTGGGNPHLISTTPPSITGVALPGRLLSCHPGAWSNSPSGYAFQWERNGMAIPGAVSAGYRVRITDEGRWLECVVVASNAAGSSSARSKGVIVALPGTLNCPRPSGRLRGARLGAISLGMTRAAARRRLRPFGARHRQVDDLCLYGGWGIEVSYGSPGLLASLSGHQRARLRERVVLATTSNPYYAVRGVRPGTSQRVARRRLRLGHGLRVRHSLWYVIHARGANVVLEVRHGTVQRIGIAERLLSRTAAAQRRILRTQS